jgi:hypothetical protein
VRIKVQFLRALTRLEIHQGRDLSGRNSEEGRFAFGIGSFIVGDIFKGVQISGVRRGVGVCEIASDPLREDVAALFDGEVAVVKRSISFRWVDDTEGNRRWFCGLAH